jgi:hypothetical protein
LTNLEQANGETSGALKSAETGANGYHLQRQQGEPAGIEGWPVDNGNHLSQ